MTPINTTLSQPHLVPAPANGSALGRVVEWIVKGHSSFSTVQSRVAQHGLRF